MPRRERERGPLNGSQSPLPPFSPSFLSLLPSDLGKAHFALVDRAMITTLAFDSEHQNLALFPPSHPAETGCNFLPWLSVGLFESFQNNGCGADDIAARWPLTIQSWL